MIVHDKLYGNFRMEGVAYEIINTKSFQRLKGIGMAGYELFIDKSHPFSKLKANRYEHSVGVFILLTKLGANLEERIAGLLYDFSILALSHIGDCVYGRFETQDFHDEIREGFIRNSEIPSILRKFGIDVNEVVDETKFGLLERKLPDLCADRLDYSLRHLIEIGKISRGEAKEILDSLIVVNNEIVFSDKEAAKNFAWLYFFLNKNYYCCPMQATLFKLISDAVKIGIKKGILTQRDLFETDYTIYRKLKNSGDQEIEELLETIRHLEVKEVERDYDMILKTKVRWVDPKVLVKGKLLRISEFDKKYTKEVKRWIRKAKRGFKVKILKKI